MDWEVDTNTMEGIFGHNKIEKIDYFSLDVEGYEMKILHSYPFATHPVTVWSIESNKLDRDELTSFMNERGYSCKHYDQINTICDLSKT